MTATLTRQEHDTNVSAPQAGRRRRTLQGLAIVAVVAAGLGIRLLFRNEQTMDYDVFISRWYNELAANGMSAFKTRFADYNYPYLYLLGILAGLHIPSLIGAKALSVLFDYVIGFFAYRIVALRTPRFSLRLLAFALVTLLPSVVANSSYWGQADAIYSAFAVGGVYFLLRCNPIWACVFFGLALSFKLQAVFVLPVLLWLVLRRYLPWYALLAIPATFALLEVPALLGGAPVHDVLTVYLDQADANKQLTLGAANLYQLIPISGDVTWLAHAGIAAAALLIAAFLAWSAWKKPAVTPESILVVATASATIVPFLLPNMHDRYFYMTEVLSVIMAFYLPLRYAIIPVLLQASAIGVYYDTLSGVQGQGFGGQGFGHHGFGNHGGPGGWQGGGGPPPGGGDHHGGPAHWNGGPSGYSSGRGDTPLTVCAALTATAVLGLLTTLTARMRGCFPARTPDVPH